MEDNAEPKVPVRYTAVSSKPLLPEFAAPMRIAAPAMVGTRANTTGSMRSFWEMMVKIKTHMNLASSVTFRSEYHPQNSVVTAATMPPGVPKMSACFELKDSVNAIRKAAHLHTSIQSL
jgi:hypothetical protein